MLSQIRKKKNWRGRSSAMNRNYPHKLRIIWIKISMQWRTIYLNENWCDDIILRDKLKQSHQRAATTFRCTFRWRKRNRPSLNNKKMPWQKPCIGLPLRAITINKARLWIFTRYYLDCQVGEWACVDLPASHLCLRFTDFLQLNLWCVLFYSLLFFRLLFRDMTWIVSVYVLLNSIKNSVFFFLLCWWFHCTNQKQYCVWLHKPCKNEMINIHRIKLATNTTQNKINNHSNCQVYKN